MRRIVLGTLLLILAGCAATKQVERNEQILHKAEQLSQSAIIVDTHIDVPYRLRNKMEDITQYTKNGDKFSGEFDYPRAKQGGLNVPFMSIYVPAEHETQKIAKSTADDLMRMMDSIITAHPEKFARAGSPADVTAQFGKGLISFAYGMENGSPIEGDLKNLKYFYDRGIRYITLTHGKDNHIGDSSYDTTHTWKGLSPFGKEVVVEMNRLGIMVDISHVSDDTFWQVLALSKAPLIASHSSCRAYTPTFQRNMSDEMIKAMAAKGGVIQINFGSDFISDEYQKKDRDRRDSINAQLRPRNLTMRDSAGRVVAHEYEMHHPLAVVDVKDVAAHIDHVAKIAGIDHVGLGSDFDGVGDSLPTGLKDVSMYPNLIYELLALGYSDANIEKVCGKNLLRVWSTVEEVAHQLQRQ
ncbi:MAG: membrane dipeptidase [Ignavibacteriales bacterium]|nr:membrane dipeptidase [Ignavibacteriales bacterium]